MVEVLLSLSLEIKNYIMLELAQQWAIAPMELRFMLIALLAGMLGSFINMAVWRVPRGESIVMPRSHCPVCKHVLGIWDLIPILSYLILKGKCRYCGINFGFRYVLIELFLSTFAVLMYYLIGLNWLFYFSVFLAAGCIFFVSIFQRTKIDASIINREIKTQGKGGTKLSSVDQNTGRVPIGNRDGFTYLEVIMTMIIVAAVIIPFGNIFLSSYSRVIKSKEYVMAFNLMEEKMEELKLVPFSKLTSDWFVFASPPDPKDGIYAANFSEHLLKMRTERLYFESNFSDILFTEKDLPRLVMQRYRKTYRNYYGVDYQFYPDDYKIFRRIVIVEPVVTKLNEKFKRVEVSPAKPISSDGNVKNDLVKVTVKVIIDSKSNSRTLQLSSYRRR